MQMQPEFKYFQIGFIPMDDKAKRIKEAIETSGVNVLDVAAKCGISRQAVYKWMRGETKKVSGENLVVLASITGYEPLWLMTGEGEKNKLFLSKDDLHAVHTSRALGVKERRAWYRAGDSLAEQTDDDDDDNEKKQNRQ